MTWISSFDKYYKECKLPIIREIWNREPGIRIEINRTFAETAIDK